MNAVNRQRLAPSFRGLESSSEAQTRAKRANSQRDTRPEITLRSEIHRLGLRFRLGTDHLPGRPDLIFVSAKAAIFCDGDFWHGRDWEILQTALRRRANPDYWIAKIGYNRMRDRQVTQELSQAGWRVLRLWGSDIMQDPEKAALEVKRFVYADHDQGSKKVANH